MAGLTTNIVTSKNRAKPLWPTPDMSLTPFYGNNSDDDGDCYLPPFANADDSKSSIKINLEATNAAIHYYDEDGTAITSGVWNSGMTVAEAASNAEHWVGLYMDSTDNMLYMVTVDVGTSPDTIYLSKVDKAGSVTAIGNAQLGNASMDYSNFYILDNETGPMYRAGGDGSGNFVIPFSNTAGGNAAAGVPNRGVNVTISASDGSLSYSSLLGTNYAQPNAAFIFGAIGPTANNIYGGPFAGRSGNPQGHPWVGSIANTSTGRSITRAIFENPTSMYNATSTIKAFRWRSSYVFGAYSEEWGPTIYSETDLHNYLDEMAVYYGIL